MSFSALVVRARYGECGEVILRETVEEIERFQKKKGDVTEELKELVQILEALAERASNRGF